MGKIFFKNGNKYEGNFDDDKINGKGIFYYNNGNKYNGNFKNGKFNGNGIFSYYNGDIYDGEYYEGKKMVKENIILIQVKNILEILKMENLKVMVRFIIIMEKSMKEIGLMI